ncbi:ABC transporter ATP-binding protein [Aneurinibacillus terranovensis]|uniref:ABC transporter ATP-binding protein n=1 Tax=Aneurinibacillus terranovensis TaxID=278991 RepID=UPI0004086B35|nr:ABC transporter ATP-binding protein [Aneurinibacillus terranovensis]
MAVGNHLSIVNATKFYKKFKAVDDVNLTVDKGEFLTILGPSGSGKTSLLKLIAGFEELSSGSILLNQQDITKKKAYEREIGMLFQNYALFPHMTVFENVAYPLHLRKVPKSEIAHKVKEILKLVHLEDYGSRYPKQLSGGQQQRVALARAIVFNPPLLLLDEPLGALDKNLRQQMQLEIKHIQETVGITTISVTHDQEEALTMSDRICVMNHGRIEQVDSPTNLYQHPKNRFVAEFIGEINLIPIQYVTVENQKAIVKILQDQMATVVVQGWEKEKKVTSLLLALRPENLQVAGEQAEFENTIHAQVYETIYVGEAIKAKAKTMTGQVITVKIPATQADTVYCGKELLLGWNSKDATLIPEEVSA